MATTNAGAISVSVTADSAQFESAMDKSAAAAERMSQRTTRAQQAAQKDSERFIASIQKQVDTFGLTGTALLRYQAQLKGVTDQAAPLIGRLEQLKEEQAQFNALSAQTNAGKGFADAAEGADKAAHASSGMTRELIVLGHEASQGNFSRFGGSLLVLAEYSKGATAALGLLVGPLGAIIGGVGLLAAAAIKGAHEQKLFNDSLILTGNYAGVTGDSFAAMTKQIAALDNAPIGKVRDSMQAVISTGRFTGDAVTSVSRTVTTLAKLSGESSSDITKSFERMSDGVAKAAEEQNKQYHFLTLADFDYIKSLEAQGRVTDAIVFSNDKLNASLNRQKESLGFLATAWKKDGEFLQWIADKAKSLGKDDTLGEQLAKEEKALANLRAQKALAPPNDANGNATDILGWGTGALDAEIAEKAKFVDNLRARFQLAQVAATAEGRLAEDNQQKILQDSGAYENSRTAQAMAGLQQRVALAELEAERTQLAINKSYEDGTLNLKGYEQMEYGIRKASIQNRLTLIEEEARLEKAKKPGTPLEVTAQDTKIVEILTKRIALQKELAVLNDQNARGELVPKTLLTTQVASPQEMFNKAERAAQAQTEAAYNENLIAGQTWIDSLKLQGAEVDKWVKKLDAETDSLGMSSDARKLAVEISRLQAEADKDLIGHESERALVMEKLAVSIDKVTAAMDRSIAKQRSFEQGAKAAFQDYYDSATNMGAAAHTLVGQFESGLEDSMTKFLSGQKTNFHSMVDALIQETMRLTVVKPIIASLFGSTGTNGILGGIYDFATGGGFGGAGSFYGGAKAAGGPVLSGGTYLVGEKGPELLQMGHSSGVVIPNGRSASSSSSTTIHVHVTATPGMSRDTAQQQGAAIAIGIRSADSRNN